MTRTQSIARTLAVAAALGLAATPSAAQHDTHPRTVIGPAGKILSPRDTVQLPVGEGRRIWIDYGRPSMRGRRIMGGLVPYGRVWRTGANAATTLVADVDVELGGTRLPRGTYTLYTIPTAGAWTLIVNRQTGQWGTQYEPSRDFARIPMHVSSLREPVEQFTILLERGRGDRPGTLALEWENTRASLPFRVVSPAAAVRR